MDFSRKGQPMSLNDSNLSPADRFLANRRKIFLRDWILVLIALGLAIAAGTFRSDRSLSKQGGPHPAAFVR
jgi:hypothetical protein